MIRYQNTYLYGEVLQKSETDEVTGQLKYRIKVSYHGKILFPVVKEDVILRCYKQSIM